MERLRLVAFQAIGQMAIVLAMPFLTRMFTPSELGWYQLAFTFGLIIQPLATLRAEFTIPSEGEDSRVSHSVSIALLASSLTVTILTFLAIILFLADRHTWALTAVMTAIISLAYSITVLDNSTMVRDQHIGGLTIRNLLSGLLTGILQVGLGYVFREVIWLAIAILLGRLIAISVARSNTLSYVSRKALRTEEVFTSRMMQGISSGFVASLNSQGTMLIVQPVLGSAAAGFVGVANRATQAPLGLISQALSQSVQATIGNSVRSQDADLLSKVNQQIKSMLPYALVATFGLLIGGPILAEPIFGAGWNMTGTVIAILAVPAGFQLLVGPIMPVYYMVAAESRLLRVQILRIVLSFAGAGIGYVISPTLVPVVTGYAIGTTIGYLFSYLDLKNFLTRQEESQPFDVQEQG